MQKPICVKRISIHFLVVAFTFLFLPKWVKSQESAKAVDYSYTRGFYSKSFKLELTTKTPGGKIRYTLDGSKPSPTNGQDYSNPVTISSNAMVRAYTNASNFNDSKIKTHSYIFHEQVIRQKNNMLEDYGYDYSSKETGKVFWTEEMDPEIVDAPAYKDEIIKGLKDIPTLSVVMAKKDLWGENGIHWGKNLDNTSDDFERECSVEMIYPDRYRGDTLKNWQENCGIKIQGGGGRWDQGTYDHKQSFTLVFKNIYGKGKLKNEIFADAPHGRESTCGKYDKIILRAGHNKSWGADKDREKSVYTRDQLGRDLQILMSGFGSHGTFVHLYLNGKYWGLYNPCERPDHDFLANNLGGESEDYFYAKGKDINASNDRTGEPGQSRLRFFEATSKDYSRMPFDEMQNWVMVDQSIASFLVYGYSNPGDGPQYYYGNNNNPPGPVVWIPWDIEDSFDGGSRRSGPPSVSNMVKSKKSGDNGFNAFWANIDFRMYFNDQVYKHFFNDGVMTDENVIKVWDKLNNYIYKAIVCESARWGDERSTNPMDRDHEWEAARLGVLNDLKGRGSYFISMLQNEGYFSKLPAPKYFTDDMEITTGSIEGQSDYSLTISKEGIAGDVYYTLDGTDPCLQNLKGTLSDKAIKMNGDTETITLNNTTLVKARTKHFGEWSPLHALLVFAKPSDNSTINVKANHKKIKLYPNPFTRWLFLSEENNYKVYSSAGNILFKGKNQKIDMNGLPKGLYLITIDNISYKINQSRLAMFVKPILKKLLTYKYRNETTCNLRSKIQWYHTIDKL
ncbi:MAG: FN3 associated domain-containing protein [Bacteroidales bacterium]